MFVERNDNNIEYVVGDIRDKSRILKHFKDVDYVMHTAALKHVPTGKQFPEEVINTNVLGTKDGILFKLSGNPFIFQCTFFSD